MKSYPLNGFVTDASGNVLYSSLSPEATKRCPACLRTLLLSAYSRRGDGHERICRECHAQRASERRSHHANFGLPKRTYVTAEMRREATQPIGPCTCGCPLQAHSGRKACRLCGRFENGQPRCPGYFEAGV